MKVKNNKNVIILHTVPQFPKSVFSFSTFFCSPIFTITFSHCCHVIYGKRPFNIHKDMHTGVIYIYTHVYVGACIHTNVGEIISFSLEKMSRVFVFSNWH